MSDTTGKFEELVNIVQRLRAPDGCPWDREQTNASLLPYFLEEAYEMIESVDNENWSELKEEVGDLLLHAVLQAVIAAENDHFTIEGSIKNINEKL
ncbi:MAG TPA: nucleoside triphosphate pyrophosphohydrolase, partial [Candidatus Marinimicrobia bacterium]|nr:nucleoside triphosphate pyrophosphohydrolase [Candidatus Neomarinimicrobiota bacterium]